VDVTQRLTDVTEEVSRAEKKQRQLECQVGEADGRGVLSSTVTLDLSCFRH